MLHCTTRVLQRLARVPRAIVDGGAAIDTGSNQDGVADTCGFHLGNQALRGRSRETLLHLTMTGAATHPAAVRAAPLTSEKSLLQVAELKGRFEGKRAGPAQGLATRLRNG